MPIILTRSGRPLNRPGSAVPGHRDTESAPTSAHSPDSPENFDTENDFRLIQFRSKKTPQRPLSALKTRTAKPHKNAATPKGYPPARQEFHLKLAASLLPALQLPQPSSTARTHEALTEQTAPPARQKSTMRGRPTSAVPGRQPRAHIEPIPVTTSGHETIKPGVVIATEPSCLATERHIRGAGYRLTKK